MRFSDHFYPGEEPEIEEKKPGRVYSFVGKAYDALREVIPTPIRKPRPRPKPEPIPEPRGLEAAALGSGEDANLLRSDEEIPEYKL